MVYIFNALRVNHFCRSWTQTVGFALLHSINIVVTAYFASKQLDENHKKVGDFILAS